MRKDTWETFIDVGVAFAMVYYWNDYNDQISKHKKQKF